MGTSASSQSQSQPIIPIWKFHSLFDLRIPYERTPSLPSSSRSRAMKGNTKSCITSHRCSDCEICNRCVAARPDPIRLLLRVHSPPPRPLHTYCTKRFAESLGRELIIIKPNAVNVVMAPAAAAAAVVVRLDHRHTYNSRPHSLTAAPLRHGDKFGLLPADHTYK